MLNVENIEDVVKNLKISEKKNGVLDKAKKEKKKEVDIKTGEVFTPKSHNKLHFYRENRILNKEKIKKMIKSISEDGLISPILVCYDGDKYCILDGQHRSIVCYLLGYNIPYVFVYSEDLHVSPIDQVQKLNTNQKNWSNKDYLRYYREKGVEFFTLFEEFKEMFPKSTPSDVVVSVMLSEKTKFTNIKSKSNEEITQMSEGMKSKFRKRVMDCKHYLDYVLSIYEIRSFVMIHGFCTFYIEEGKKDKQKLNDFIDYVDIMAENGELIWRHPPKTETEWKYHFSRMFKESMDCS